MSVSSTQNKVIYTGSGTTGPFDFDFRVFASSDLVVDKYTIATGATVTLTETTDYSVTIDIDGTGHIDTVVAVTSAYQIIIRRVLPVTQEIAYVENDKFPSASHEEGLDRSVMIAQQLQEQIDRAVLQNTSATTQITLPGPVENNALVWDGSGNLVNSDSALVGPTGPQGPTGPAGSAGADGIFSAIASQAEAEAGSENTKGMTPLRAAQAIAALGGGKSYAGSLSRDLTTASGDVAYTGIGFTPKTITFWGNVPNTLSVSFGTSNGTNNQHMTQYPGWGAGLFTNGTDACVAFDQPNTSTAQKAVVKTMDADGFTLTWTKAGSPTGTATVIFIAIG